MVQPLLQSNVVGASRRSPSGPRSICQPTAARSPQVGQSVQVMRSSGTPLLAPSGPGRAAGTATGPVRLNEGGRGKVRPAGVSDTAAPTGARSDVDHDLIVPGVESGHLLRREGPAAAAHLGHLGEEVLPCDAGREEDEEVGRVVPVVAEAVHATLVHQREVTGRVRPPGAAGVDRQPAGEHVEGLGERLVIVPAPGLCGARRYSTRPKRPAVCEPGATMRRALVSPAATIGCSARVRTTAEPGSGWDTAATLAPTCGDVDPSRPLELSVTTRQRNSLWTRCVRHAALREQVVTPGHRHTAAEVR